MGRLEHLQRVGFGLSAFRPLEASVNEDRGDVADMQAAGQGHSQQYDSKGRPTNPSVERLRAEQRYAQNEVLEFANVVERKQHTCYHWSSQEEFDVHKRSDHVQPQAWPAAVSLLLSWYPQIILERCLLGLFEPDIPFSQIFANDFAKIQHGSLVDGLNVVWPGLGLSASYALLYTLFHGLLGQSATTFVDNCPAIAPGVFDAVMITVVLCRFAVQVGLLPILQLGRCTRLGLVQCRNLVSMTTTLMQFQRMSSRSPWTMHLPSLAVPLLSFRRDNQSVALAQAVLLGEKHDLRNDWHQSQASQSFLHAVSTTFRQVTLYTVDEMNADRSSHQSEAKPVAIESHLLSAAMSIFRRLLQLPVDLLVVQCSARAFHRLVGPVEQTGGVVELPIVNFFRGSFQSSTTAGLKTLSKVGLALGLLCSIDAAIYGSVYAFTAHRGTQPARRLRLLSDGD